MGIFGSDSKDILRRLDKVEEHFQSCDERTANTLVVEAELTSQIKEMARSFKDYIDREESTMKEYARREEQQGIETKKIMAEIKDDVSEIKQHQITQPKDVVIQLANLREDMSEKYETKENVEEKINRIKSIGKWMWSFIGVIIIASATTFSWLVKFAFDVINMNPMLK